MKRSLVLIILSFAFAAALGCSPEIKLLDETKLKDFSLLDGEPCDAPCWNTIVPGETSYRDAKLQVEEDARYKDVQEPERKEDSDARIFSFSPAEEGGGGACCRIFSRDGETITSLLLQFAPDMRLGPALDRHGEPVYLGGEAPAAEQAYMALVFDAVPMVLYVFVAGAEEGALSVSSEIIGAMYMTREEMDLLLGCSRLYAWEGFRAYKDIIDDKYDYVGADVDNEEVCGAA